MEMVVARSDTEKTRGLKKRGIPVDDGDTGTGGTNTNTNNNTKVAWKDVCSIPQQCHRLSESWVEGDWVISRLSKSKWGYVLMHVPSGEEEEYNQRLLDFDVRVAARYFSIGAEESGGIYRLRITMHPDKRQLRVRLQVKISSDHHHHHPLTADHQIVVLNQEILVAQMLSRGGEAIHSSRLKFPENKAFLQLPHGNNLEYMDAPTTMEGTGGIKIPGFKYDEYDLHPHQIGTIKSMMLRSSRGGIGLGYNNNFIPIEEDEDEDERYPVVCTESGRVIWIGTKKKRKRVLSVIDIKGALMADAIGSGKTLSMLSFAMVMDCIRKRTYTEDERQKRLNAICILPHNLAGQWKLAAHKFFGDGMRVLVFDSIKQVNTLKWTDLLEAHLIICSDKFILNPSSRSIVDVWVKKLTMGSSIQHMNKVSSNMDADKWKEGVVPTHPLLARYSVVFVDEFCALFKEDQKTYVNHRRLWTSVKALAENASSVFVASATPDLDCRWMFELMIDVLSVHSCQTLNLSFGIPLDLQRKFIRECIIAHNPPLRLPKLVTDTVLVKLSHKEEILVKALGGNVMEVIDNASCVIQCAKGKEGTEEVFKTLNETTGDMIRDLITKISDLDKRSRVLGTILDVNKKEYLDQGGNPEKIDAILDAGEEENLEEEEADGDGEMEEEDEVQIALNQYRRSSRMDTVRRMRENFHKFKEEEEKKKELTRKVKWIKNELASHTKRDDPVNCSVCMEEITIPAVFPCGHSSYCMSCAKESIKRAAKCPTCRVPAQLNQVVFVREDGVEEGRRNYGEKVNKILEYVMTAVTPTEGKCIIFTEFSRLADRITVALKDLGVRVAKLLKCNTRTMTKRIRDLREGQIDVVLLSLEESAEGIDLNCVTHVIFAHALCNPSIDQRISTWKQAVGRAWRQGNDVDALYVMHFIAKDTLDEKEHEKLMKNISV